MNSRATVIRTIEYFESALKLLWDCDPDLVWIQLGSS